MVPHVAKKLTLKLVNVKAWSQLKELVTRNIHTKYECPIINTSGDMSQVNVFVIDRRTNEFKATHPACKHNQHIWIFQFYTMFFTIKLLIPDKLIAQDKLFRSYSCPDYPLFTLYFAVFMMRIPSITGEIRATGDFKLHSCI